MTFQVHVKSSSHICEIVKKKYTLEASWTLFWTISLVLLGKKARIKNFFWKIRKLIENLLF